MDRLVEIRRYDNPVDAHILLDLLTDAGIPARIFDEHTGAALPHVGAIGVRVVVRAEDAARAAAAIAEDEARGRGPATGTPEDAEEMPWRVGEGEAHEGPGDDDTEEEEEEEAAADDRGAQPAPVRSGPPESTTDREAAAFAYATRTRTFAIVGIALFPFAFGAVFRAIDAPPGVAEHPPARRRMRQALILAGCTIFLVAALVLASWTGLLFGSRR